MRRDKESPTGEVFGTEEALARIMMEMLKPDDIRLFTVSDVTPEEIFGLSTILQYANIFNSDAIRNWIKSFLLLRISRYRFGRDEFIMLGSGIKEFLEIKKKGSKLSDLFSGFK